MKNKVLSVLLALILFSSFLPVFDEETSVFRALHEAEESFVSSAGSVEVSAKAAALITENGDVLFEKNGNKRLGIASTTKIMTCLVVLESVKLHETVVVSREAVGVEGSSLYLKEGERLTVEELLYGLMLGSGNDAAVALAVFCFGSVERFVDKMNEKARELGLVDTHFSNPHGLNHEEHYSTAIELGMITVHALENEKFVDIVSTYTHRIPLDGVDGGRLLVNHNKLLKLYDSAIGVKTGYTKSTGRTLVGAARRDGLTLVSVTLDDRDDWHDHKTMLDFGFSNYEALTLRQVRVPIIVNGGVEERCVGVTTDKRSIILKKGSKLETKIIIPEALEAPIRIGERLGVVEYYCDGILVRSCGIFAEAEVRRRKVSFWEKLFDG